MKRTLVSLLAAITLLGTAYVQTRDEFNGGFSLQWSWKLPDNDPFCPARQRRLIRRQLDDDHNAGWWDVWDIQQAQKCAHPARL